ncbi:zincin-like metallopeptidase domain-containing protein [Niastella populi]|uniref:DUF1738 domain-containing protein n=1 Tax=Niastella populi TaxID=550983 RepID=A0A1V9GAC3_9BACT|nr:zincin-like metallopeptidase domain-containing protein [Niastella populi]OQP67484.1 hypothetical protein A4R26_33425 [Niastella populi]
MFKTPKLTGSHEVFKTVNDAFCRKLSQGIIPWHQSFKEIPADMTGSTFLNVNMWLLGDLGYPRNVFLSKEQIKSTGWTIKGGERGHLIVHLNNDENNPCLIRKTVYNIAQVSGIQREQIPPLITTGNPIGACKSILRYVPDMVPIEDTGTYAFYRRSDDIIDMPQPEYFENDAQWYSTLFYQLIASTGHAKRLGWDKRLEQKPYDKQVYCLELLVIEMCCSCLCAYGEIEPWFLSRYHSNSEGWLHTLESDATLAVIAGSYMQPIVSYILNLDERAKNLKLFPVSII